MHKGSMVHLEATHLVELSTVKAYVDGYIYCNLLEYGWHSVIEIYLTTKYSLLFSINAPVLQCKKSKHSGF